MTLKKNFLSPNIADFHIGKREFLFGILIGLIFSLGFYSLVYVFREYLREISMYRSFNYCIVSDQRMFEYNLFTAYWALILGQSFSFNYWMTKPIPAVGIIRIRRKAILNDQRNLNWTAASAISRMAWVIGSFFFLLFPGAYDLLDGLSDYQFAFYLFILVLFLNSWVTIRRVFKRHSFRWMLVTAFTISVLAFGMANINLIDYNKVNERYLSAPKYSIEMPSANYNQFINFYTFHHIYIYKFKASSNNEPQITIRGKVVSKSELIHVLDSAYNATPAYSRMRMNVVLIIDKNVKLQFVQSIRYNIYLRTKIRRIFYGVAPKNTRQNKKYFIEEPRFVYMPPFADAWKIRAISPPLPPPPKPTEHFYSNVINIAMDSVGRVKLNNKAIKLELLEDQLKKLVLHDSDYVFYIRVDSSMKFNDYVNLYDAINGSIYSIRNKLANKCWHRDFYRLREEEQRIIQGRFSMRYIEYYWADSYNKTELQ